MDAIPRQKLCEIILRYGSSLSGEPQRCEALLRDLCGQYRKEISALVSAVKEGITRELLLSDNPISPETLLESLTQRLQENSGLSEEAARWTVESWALALGVIDSHALNEATVLQNTEFTPSISPPVEDTFTFNTELQPKFQQLPASNFWQKMAIVGSVIGIFFVGSLVYFQAQQQQDFQAKQQQAIEQEVARLKEEEEQLRLEEATKREEAERQLLEEKRQREESERQLEAERLQREETERQLREEQRRKKAPSQPPVTPSRVGVAIVFDPPSNVRKSPNGEIICSVRERTTIDIHGSLGSWYYTDVCGTMGMIHSSQITFQLN